MGKLASFIPAVAWLRAYRPGHLPRDLAGGLAVGAMLIPQGLAFAQIVQVPPVAGLWSGVAAMLGYALLGPSRRLMVGPEAGTAMMVAAVLTTAGLVGPQERLGAASLLAMMVAAILTLAGLFRLGAIADFLSRPILVGYINGIALTLVASQVPSALGIASTREEFLPQLMELGENLAGLHWPTLLVTTVALVFLLLLRRVLPKAPGALLVVAAAIPLSRQLDFEARGIALLGPIQQALPQIGLPPMRADRILALETGALGIALLIYASSVLTSRVFADKHREDVDANQEFFGLAASNLLCGLTHGIPAAGSDTRTLINDAAGARTQLAGLIAALAVVAVIFFLAPLMSLLPNAALSAVVIASALSLFDVRGFVRIWRVRPSEGLHAAVTLLGVLLLGILPGVLVAVTLALADLLRRAARPHDAVLGRVKGRPGYQDIERQPGSETLPGLIIYRIDGPLFFANARFLSERVRELVKSAESPVLMVVLDCGGVFELDVTAAETLEELDRGLHAHGIRLGLAEPHAPLRKVLQRTGLLQKIGPEDIFATVEEAISAYVERTEDDLGDEIEWVRVHDARPSSAGVASRPDGEAPTR